MTRARSPRRTLVSSRPATPEDVARLLRGPGSVVTRVEAQTMRVLVWADGTESLVEGVRP